MPYKKLKSKKSFKPRNVKQVKSGPKVDRDHRFKQIDSYRIKPEPFPRVLLTRAKFGYSTVLTTGFVNIAVADTYRLNSIWDPDVAIGGRTVAGHAQLAALYGSYWVMGAKVQLTFTDPTKDGSRVGIRLLTAGSTSIVGQDMRLALESNNTYINTVNNTGSQKKSFNLYIKPWSLFGVSKLEYMANSSLYSSLINASPALDGCRMQVFHISGTEVGSIQYDLRITYYIKLYDRKFLVST